MIAIGVLARDKPQRVYCHPQVRVTVPVGSSIASNHWLFKLHIQALENLHLISDYGSL